MRLFTAILLPDEVRDHLHQLGDRLAEMINAKTLGKGEVKWVAPQTLHLTLKFLGEVDDTKVPSLVDRLRRSARAPPSPFTIQPAGIECLPPNRHAPIRVIAASVAGPVERLQQAYTTIEMACEPFGIPPERRPFLPHMTLGRCRNPLPAFLRQALEHVSQAGGPWFLVSESALVQSTLKPEGPEYRTIATFPAA